MEKVLNEKLTISDVQCNQNLLATEDALYVLGGKWTLRVMVATLSGYTRFNELQRNVKGISARVLSSELKDLELNGLIKRVAFDELQPTLMEYLPTEYSNSLKDIIGALAAWGERHKKKITMQA